MSRLFNGSSDIIVADTAHLTHGSGDFTVSFWVNYTGVANNTFMYAEGNSGSGSPFFGISSGDTTGSRNVRAFLRDNGGITKVNLYTAVSTTTDGLWHFVFGRCTDLGSGNSRFDLVVDGVNANQQFSNTTMTVDRTAIGALRRSSNSNFLTGTIAHVATWSRALSDGEGSSLLDGLLASHFAPDHYWPLLGDSPEVDLGVGSRVAGTVTGTTVTAGSPVGRSLLAVAS